MAGDSPTMTSAAFTAADIEQLADTAVNPFVVIDDAGTAVWASASIHELLGISASDLVGRSMLDLVAPESLDAALRLLATASDGRRGDAPVQWEGTGPALELVRADGSRITCSIAAATPARTGLPGYVLQLRRADPTQALERTLVAMGTDRPLGEVFAQIAAVLQAELPDAEVLIVHPRHPSGELDVAPRPPGELAEVALASVTGAAWSATLAGSGNVVDILIDQLPELIRVPAAAAGIRWLAVHAVAPAIEGDPTTAAVVSVWSRTDFRMHVLNHDRIRRCGKLVAMALRWEYGRRAIQWAATHDGLTGLLNRSSFLDELAAAGGIGRRATDRTAVLYLDLDDFKPVNDQHGHALGDRVLVEVSSRLRSAVRPSDLVARLGGDEFAVLCPGLVDLDVAKQLAERLVREVGVPIEIDGLEVRIGLSVGIASLRDDEGAERVLTRADDALRAAKTEGKARWKLG